MKRVGFVMVLFFTMLSCKTQEGTTAQNEEKAVKVKVVRDCSGTYINVEGKDYKVCNEEILAAYEPSDEIEIIYNTVAACDMKEGVAVCMLYHENEGDVKVLSVL